MQATSLCKPLTLVFLAVNTLKLKISSIMMSRQEL